MGRRSERAPARFEPDASDPGPARTARTEQEVTFVYFIIEDIFVFTLLPAITLVSHCVFLIIQSTRVTI